MILTYTLAILLMFSLPVVAAVMLRRRVAAPWFLFLAGVATFAVSQAVHLPLNAGLTRLGWLPEQTRASSAPLWRTALLLGLTSGLCEESARALGYALLPRWRRFEHSLLLGLGHGGFEAMVVGVLAAASLSSLAALRGVDLQTLALSPEQLTALTAQMQVFEQGPLSAALPLLERVLAMTLHVILSVLVWRAFVSRKAIYYLAAVAYHAVANATLVMVSESTDSVLLTYTVLALLLAPGLWWLVRLWRQAPLSPSPVAPWKVEAAAFLAAVRKELLQQWRTKRVLVVAAVFILFGLFSPLLAYFTPQIVSGVEGAEMFADLIPTPTAVDAIGQYLKNLSQFGFIIAVLLGMGAVAGERERGTAALVLSKPLPRWAFILSKFTAQTVVYAGGFLVAGLGAYFYTVVLFGALDFGLFMAINALLSLWLMVFVAVALLGSAVGGSTGAAAGIGLGGAVALLLAGSLPRVGPLMPGGLLAWAGQLGALNGAAAPSNGGAIAAAGVLMLLCLLGALAAFERQEL
ncbi:MAG: YhfC family glutamic-type intramembrane protease [Anaerolineae bacterium]|jgi:ABC-2 type transport system permease protein|nr:YhfC family glutamic-type intramembrane protease [Anaerolineae bacterium]